MDKENEPTKILEFLARIKTVRQAASSMTFQAFPLRQMIKATLFSECTFSLSGDECGSKCYCQLGRARVGCFAQIPRTVSSRRH